MRHFFLEEYNADVWRKFREHEEVWAFSAKYFAEVNLKKLLHELEQVLQMEAEAAYAVLEKDIKSGGKLRLTSKTLHDFLRDLKAFMEKVELPGGSI